MALRIATWNTNGLLDKKYDVEVLLKMQNLDIFLISESHLTEQTTLILNGYITYKTPHPDNTAHAGTAIIIRDNIKHQLLPQYQTPKIQATSIMVHDKQGEITLSSVYCPPKKRWTTETDDTDFHEYFKTLGNKFIAGGDWNAKNILWGSRLTTTRGRRLKHCLTNNRLQTITTGRPTYWPTDVNRLPDLLDFFIYKGVQSYFLDIDDCHDTTSDHSPVILTMSTTIISRPRNPYLYNNRTDWDYFQQYLNKNLDLKIPLKTDDDIENATILLTKCIQNAARASTPNDSKPMKTINNLPIHVKQKVLEKRRLRRVWHCSRHPDDKRAFNKAAAELKKVLIDAENELEPVPTKPNTY